jgi:hypothetical protein
MPCAGAVRRGVLRAKALTRLAITYRFVSVRLKQSLLVEKKVARSWGSFPHRIMALRNPAATS